MSDQQIDELLGEPKSLPVGYRDRLMPRPKRGHSERNLDVIGERGSAFRVIVRQSTINPSDFSVILAHKPVGSGRFLRLRRYNGSSHQHTNTIEGDTIEGFHIHKATERYQERGLRIDGWAEATNRYSDLHGAIGCLVGDCGLVPSAGEGLALF